MTAITDRGRTLARPDEPTATPGGSLRWLGALVAAAGLLASTGCEEGRLTPPEPPDAGERFERYVALGNSITAGFQSSGINDSTQRQSYAVLLAEKMGTEFNLPALNRPGCPPPLVNVFTGERVAGGGPRDCAFRATPVPEVVHNLAVPRAAVIDALMNLGPETNANALTQLILGGRTQLEAASEVRPTFASVWLGNDDVLGAALTGAPGRATSTTDFISRYRAVLDSLEAGSAEGGLDAVLVGVADLTLVPHLSPGAAYLEAERRDDMLPEGQQGFPANFEVARTCAPSAAGGNLVPFTYGFGVMINLARQLPEARTITLDCADDRPVEDIVADQVGPGFVPDRFRGISLLTREEAATLRQRVASFNGVIQSEASDRDFAFFDPNPALRARREAGQIPLFPNAVDDPQTGPVEPVALPFGPLFSRDGVHPSARAHRLVADSLASAINQQLGSDLPVGGG